MTSAPARIILSGLSCPSLFQRKTIGVWMQFNVSQLLKEPIGSTRSYTIDEAQALLLGENTSRVVGRVRMLRTDFAVFVDCSTDTSVICVCSRCLESYHQELSFSFQEEFLPMVDVNTGVPVRLDDERDSVFTIDQNHILDLTEAIRQYTVMNLPMKPLCDADCRGICPSCGIIRLVGHACDTSELVSDQRWRPLIGMF